MSMIDIEIKAKVQKVDEFFNVRFHCGCQCNVFE